MILKVEFWHVSLRMRSTRVLFSKLLREVEREFLLENLLLRVPFVIVMIRWTGLEPWEFEFHFPGSLTFTFLVQEVPLHPPRYSFFFACHSVERDPFMKSHLSSRNGF